MLVSKIGVGIGVKIDRFSFQSTGQNPFLLLMLRMEVN